MFKKLVAAIKAIFIFYILLNITIWFVSPWLVSYFVSPILLEKNLALSDESTIRYNPFISQTVLSDIELYAVNDADKQPVLSVKSVNIELSLWRLTSKVLHISQIEISGLTVNIDKSENKLVIAGWPLGSSQEKESLTSKPQPDTQAENSNDDYQLFSPNIKVSNSNINLNWLGHQHKLSLSNITIEQLLLSTQEQQGSITLALLLNNSHINVNAEISLEGLVGSIDAKVNVDALDIAQLNHFIFP